MPVLGYLDPGPVEFLGLGHVVVLVRLVVVVLAADAACEAIQNRTIAWDIDIEEALDGGQPVTRNF